MRPRYVMEQLLSEPHLWKVTPLGAEKDDADAICGLIMTYVDDLFMVSRMNRLLEIIKAKAL